MVPIRTRNGRLQLQRLQGQLRDEGISSSSENMVDNNDINMEEVTMDFILNSVKAIKRKRLDANQEKLKAILTTGSNLILEVNTATFKMAREGIRTIMESIEQCKPKTVTLTKKSDKENNIVEECYRRPHN